MEIDDSKPLNIFFGPGTVDQLTNIFNRHHAKNVFLVTGTQSFDSCTADSNLTSILSGVKFNRHSHQGSYTSTEDLESALSVFGTDEFDLIIAVGGGRVIDLAKLVRFFSNPESNVRDYLKNQIPFRLTGAPPLVALPTTAGSGSEVTQFAVIYLDNLKYSVSDRSLLPDYAIVDPALTFNMPATVAASSGMDALSQAIESYWSTRSNTESRGYSRESILLAMQFLKESVLEGSREAREGMAKAALLAGKAINITTTTAPHAISYPLTTIHGVPHGHAVALTLGALFVHNAGVDEDDVNDARGAAYVKKSISEINELLGCPSDIASRNMLRELMQSIGLETDLRKIGVSNRADVDAIIEQINVERLRNNPRDLTRDDLQEILLELCGGIS
ncbi:MAG: phosphonoacetaldehyde reductase [Candidatus Obscuribacterales bacterium]|nr:phosphonoacetaldehyde reductase [Candidatus Obscuribacterales bacterium]